MAFTDKLQDLRKEAIQSINSNTDKLNEVDCKKFARYLDGRQRYWYKLPVDELALLTTDTICDLADALVKKITL